MTRYIGDDKIGRIQTHKKYWCLPPEHRHDDKALDVTPIMRRLTVSAALIACLCLVSQNATAAEDNDVAARVRTIVAGIVSYTRWPQQQVQPKLCIFSSSVFSAALARASSSTDGIPYHPQVVHSLNEALLSQCDGLYFGSESPQQQLQIIEQYHPRPLLLIAEQNTQCTLGSSFCLNIKNSHVSFSVNLDSLTRSGVRVNPDVLLLARPRNNNDE